MDISVIIPIYGVEKYIEKCLRSLFTQTKTENVEFILVNDCTKDNSMEVAQRVINEFPDLAVKIINHKVNSGLACARNTGVNAASGIYIQHIDSDDWVEPTMLEELYNKAIECDADIVSSDYYIDTEKSLRYITSIHPHDNVECLRELLSASLVHSLCFKLVKKELYEKDGVNYHLPCVDVWEDLVASVKLFYFAKSVVHLPKAFYHYMHISTDSISRGHFSQKKLDNIIDAFNDVELFLNKTPLKTNLERNIIDRKIYVKFSLLKWSGENQKEYAGIYPEIDRLIFSQQGMPYHNKLALYFGSKNIIWMFNFILNSVKYVKKLKGKI